MVTKNYNFGEKSKESYKTKEGWNELEVWQTPKYLISRNKAIELIGSGKYGLDEGDFWILKNQGGKKLCYTGLIISHNGCLKINDKLEIELKFKPSSVSFVKDAGNKDKVLSYIHEGQGVYEFGEISADNCKNDYPYAMVLKRLMDRVILKNSKVGFFGIYSEAESEDFKDKPEPKENPLDNPTITEALGAKRNAFGLKAGSALTDGSAMKEVFDKQDEMFDLIKLHITNRGSIAELEAACAEKRADVDGLNKTLQAKIKKVKAAEIARINGEESEPKIYEIYGGVGE